MFFNNKSNHFTHEYSYFFNNNINNWNFNNLIFNIKIYNVRSFLFYKVNKNNFLNNFLKIKIRLNNKKNQLHFFKKYNNPFSITTLKYFKLKKIITNQPLSLILKNRRLLKHFFSVFKLKSNKLTKKILNLYKYYSVYKSKLSLILGYVILNTGLCVNISDLYYFLKSKLIKINNKVVTSFFYSLNINDVVSFRQLMYFSRYNNYFKQINFKWFRRKKRKNTTILKKYLNFNKNSIKITKILKRWLSLFSTNTLKNNFMEIDYRVCLIFIFNLFFIKQQSIFLNLFFNNFMIFNLWYYKF